MNTSTKPLIPWPSIAALPPSMRGPIEIVDRWGTPLKAGRPREAFVVDDYGKQDLPDHLWSRHLHEWQEGDSVTATTGDYFDVLQVRPSEGGLRTYAMIEHLTRMEGPPAIIGLSGGRFEVIIGGDGSEVLWGGVQTKSLSYVIEIPSIPADDPGCTATWLREPTSSTPPVPNRNISMALELMRRRTPALGRDDHASQDRGQLVPASYSRQVDAIAARVNGTDTDHLFNQLYLAASTIGELLPLSRAVSVRAENALLRRAADNPSIHNIGFATCLSVIRSGLEAGPSGLLTVTRREGDLESITVIRSQGFEYGDLPRDRA